MRASILQGDGGIETFDRDRGDIIAGLNHAMIKHLVPSLLNELSLDTFSPQPT